MKTKHPVLQTLLELDKVCAVVVGPQYLTAKVATEMCETFNGLRANESDVIALHEQRLVVFETESLGDWEKAKQLVDFFEGKLVYVYDVLETTQEIIRQLNLAKKSTSHLRQAISHLILTDQPGNSPSNQVQFQLLCEANRVYADTIKVLEAFIQEQPGETFFAGTVQQFKPHITTNRPLFGEGKKPKGVYPSWLAQDPPTETDLNQIKFLVGKLNHLTGQDRDVPTAQSHNDAMAIRQQLQDEIRRLENGFRPAGMSYGFHHRKEVIH